MSLTRTIGAGLLVLAGSSGIAYAQSTYLPFGDAFKAGREARCHMAVCFGGGGDEYAVEPLIDLPVGTTFALSLGKDNALGEFYNAVNVTADFTAGLRVWLFHDWLSASVYFSRPVLPSEKTIHVLGSDFEHPASAVRHPYPGFAIGLLGDVFWIGFDYNELRNGDTDTTRDPNFRPNERLSSVWSVTVGIATATAIRDGIGTVTSRRSQQVEEEAERATDRAIASEKSASDAKEVADRAATRAEVAAKGKGDEATKSLGEAKALLEEGERLLKASRDAASDAKAAADHAVATSAGTRDEVRDAAAAAKARADDLQAKVSEATVSLQVAQTAIDTAEAAIEAAKTPAKPPAAPGSPGAPDAG
jgi:hypothetical protein